MFDSLIEIRGSNCFGHVNYKQIGTFLSFSTVLAQLLCLTNFYSSTTFADVVISLFCYIIHYLEYSYSTFCGSSRGKNFNFSEPL